jgi:hypothetical protein
MIIVYKVFKHSVMFGGARLHSGLRSLGFISRRWLSLITIAAKDKRHNSATLTDSFSFRTRKNCQQLIVGRDT